MNEFPWNHSILGRIERLNTEEIQGEKGENSEEVNYTVSSISSGGSREHRWKTIFVLTRGDKPRIIRGGVR